MSKQTSIRHRLSSLLLFLYRRSSIFLLLLVSLFVFSVTTTWGAKGVLFVVKRFAPSSIQFVNVSGSIVGSLHIETIIVDDQLYLYDNHVQFVRQPRISLGLSSKRADLRVESLDSGLIENMPVDASGVIYQFTQLTDLEAKLGLFEKHYLASAKYLDRSYRFIYQGKFRQLIISSGNDTKQLTIKEESHHAGVYHVIAFGSLVLPNDQVIQLNNWQSVTQPGSLSIKGSGQSESRQTQLKLIVDPVDRSNHHVDFLFETPGTKIEVVGQVGKASDLAISLHNDNLGYKSFSMSHNRLQAAVHNDWVTPEVSLSLKSDRVAYNTMLLKKVQWHYAIDRSVTPSWVLGQSSLKVSQVFSGKSLLIKDLSIGNLSDLGPQHHRFSMTHDATASSGQFSVTEQTNHIEVALHQLKLNRNEIIAESSAQTIAIYTDHIALNHERAHPSAGIKGHVYFDGRYDLTLTSKDLPLETFPITWWRYCLPELETFQGRVSSNVSLNSPSLMLTPRLSGDFSIDFTRLQLNSLVENVPLDTALFVNKGTFNGRFNPELSATGKLYTNHGPLNIDLKSSESFQNLHAKIIGQDVGLGRSARSSARIDTNIDLDYADNQLSITGDIKVKQAVYRLDFFHPVVSLPVETSIINSKSGPTDHLRYKFSIDCDLGQQTQVHVIGFHGQLTGRLSISGTDSTQTTANGSLIMNDGTLVIYRQTLPLRRLNINWFNTPIVSPEINMQIMASGLRNIDGRDQMQEYGLRVFGPLNQLQFDYFSSPMPMNSFQIITALLTDSSFTKKSNQESLDRMLIAYQADRRNAQLSEILDILNAIKSIPFFDNIDVSEVSFDENNGFVPEVNGVTITKRLDKNFSVRYRMTPYNQRYNRLSLDTYLNDRFIFTGFVQNEGDVGVSLNYFRSS